MEGRGLQQFNVVVLDDMLARAEAGEQNKTNRFFAALVYQKLTAPCAKTNRIFRGAGTVEIGKVEGGDLSPLQSLVADDLDTLGRAKIP